MEIKFAKCEQNGQQLKLKSYTPQLTHSVVSSKVLVDEDIIDAATNKNTIPFESSNNRK